MDKSIQALHRNIAEWLAGPSGSIFLHAALILALLFLIDFAKEPPEPPTIEVTYLEVKEPQADLPPPDVEPLPQETPFEPDPTFLQTADIQPEFTLEPEIHDFSTPDPVPRTLEALTIEQVPSSLIMPNLAAAPLQSRLGAGGHAADGERYGGPHWRHAEAAVRRALEWLRLNQNPDGSWGAQDREAYAGLGILTFLAHGETTASVKYGETVSRALRYLLARQNAAGEFARTDTTGGTYSQAICVYAVSEAYGMTRIPALRPAMEKGVQVLLDGQQAGGGFDYRFAKGGRRDTSLGGWCMQAMKAAFIAGAGNPGLKNAMDLAAADLKGSQRDDGRFAYTDRGSHFTDSITAVAVLGLQLSGHHRSPAVRRGLDALHAARCDWRNPPAWPMYAWYYISQAKFHQGGGSWQKWNNEFAPEFIRSQNEDGSWVSAGLALRSGITGRENYHPVYSTTLAALTLQVYYRLLPTFLPVEEQQIVVESSDDIPIQVL